MSALRSRGDGAPAHREETSSVVGPRTAPGAPSREVRYSGRRRRSRPPHPEDPPIDSRRFIAYPRGRILAVADDAEVADRAVAALADVGWDPGGVERLNGPEDARALDATGAGHGLGARLQRLVQFSLMDQLPDLAWYQAAAREGRVVLVVRAGDGHASARAGAILAAAGCHFINRFGRFQTEEILRWRGPEPRVANVMRR